MADAIKSSKFPDTNTWGAAFNLADILNQTHQYAAQKEYAETFQPFYKELSDSLVFMWPFILSITLSLRMAKTIEAYRL
jgi:hypothetical protein